MKRALTVLACVIACFACVAYAAGEDILYEEDFGIVAAGQMCGDDAPLLSSKAGWLLPLRTTVTKLGIRDEEIIWDENARSVTLGGISLSAGESFAKISGEKIRLERTVAVHKGRVYVPLDFYEKAFDCITMWDNRLGVVYIQKREVYDKIYAMLGNAYTFDLKKTRWFSFEYAAYSEVRDAENGMFLDGQRRSGTAEYNVNTRECLDEGELKLWERAFPFKNHLRNGRLYQTKLGKTVELQDAEAFIGSMLSTVFLSEKDGDLANIPIISNARGAMDDLTQLQKYALVLSVEDAEKAGATLISGSLLGLERAATGSAVRQRYAEYLIDNASGKLLELREESAVESVKHGVSVITKSGWSCRY